MKDCTEEELTEGRPVTIDALEGMDFCLRQLFKDKRHIVTDEVVLSLTFEELIGALLLAKDFIEDHTPGLRRAQFLASRAIAKLEKKKG